MVKKNQKPQRNVMTLEGQMAAIGVMVSAATLSQREIDAVDIETVLVEMITAIAREGASLRLPTLLLSWVAEHGGAVIVEKLQRLLVERKRSGEDVSVTALCAQFAGRCGHKRWAPLVKRFAPRTTRYLGPRELAESLVRLRGKENWADGSGFVVPSGSLETSTKWVLSQSSLAKLSRQYQNRLVFGAQWRADIITAIQRGARTPAEISRMSGASYEPCYRVNLELGLAGWPDIALRPEGNGHKVA